MTPQAAGPVANLRHRGSWRPTGPSDESVVAVMSGRLRVRCSAFTWPATVNAVNGGVQSPRR